MTLKIGSRSPKSDQFFCISKTYIYAGLVKIQPSHQEIQCKKTFSTFYDPLENGVKNLSALKHVPMIYPCKFSGIPPTDSRDIMGSWVQEVRRRRRRNPHRNQYVPAYLGVCVGRGIIITTRTAGESGKLQLAV